VDLLRFAVEVARRGRETQVGVAVEQCLREVVAGRQRGEMADREGEGSLVEHGDRARVEGGYVTRQSFRRIEASAAERKARLGIALLGQDQE